MTRDARLSALHRGDFWPGAALRSPALPPDPCSELLAARSSCLAGGVPDLPSPRLRAQPRDATPRSAFRIVCGDPTSPTTRKIRRPRKSTVNGYELQIKNGVPIAWADPNRLMLPAKSHT
jgi:hypothetical protein